MSLLKNDPNPSMFEKAEPKKKNKRREISRSPKVRIPTPTFDPKRTTPDPRASPYHSPRGGGASKKGSPVSRSPFSPNGQTKKSDSSGPANISGAKPKTVSKPVPVRNPIKEIKLKRADSWLNQNKANVDILRKCIKAGISQIKLSDLDDKTEFLAWLTRVLNERNLYEKFNMEELFFLSKTSVDWLRDMWPKIKNEIRRNIRESNKRGIPVKVRRNRKMFEKSLKSFFNTKIDERFPHAKRSGKKKGNGMSRSRTL